MKGFTLVEMLVTLIVFAITTMTLTVLFRDVNRMSIISSEIDKSFEEINYSHEIVNVVSKFVERLGRHVDTINVSEKSISGKVFVMNENIDATLVARLIDDGDSQVLEMVLQTPSGEDVLLEVPNADVYFRLADEYSDKLGATVELKIIRWKPEKDARVERRILIPMPLVNVR